MNRFKSDWVPERRLTSARALPSAFHYYADDTPRADVQERYPAAADRRLRRAA